MIPDISAWRKGARGNWPRPAAGGRGAGDWRRVTGNRRGTYPRIGLGLSDGPLERTALQGDDRWTRASANTIAKASLATAAAVQWSVSVPTAIGTIARRANRWRCRLVAGACWRGADGAKAAALGSARKDRHKQRRLGRSARRGFPPRTLAHRWISRRQADGQGQSWPDRR